MSVPDEVHGIDARSKGCDCGKTPCECGKGDERETPTKMDLLKNKMRAKGIKVAGLTLAPRNMKTYDELGEGTIADRAKNAVADDRLSDEQERTNSSMDKLRAQTKRHNKSTALARTQARIAAKKSEDTARAMHPKPGVSGRRIEDPKPTGSKPSGYRIESAEDRARDEHQMRGGMAARKDYDRPPAKKLSNAELGIKPMTPEQRAKRAKEMSAHLKKMK